jgi:hypothetical protein
VIERCNPSTLITEERRVIVNGLTRDTAILQP